MDHDTAVRINATERYFLGELSEQDRDSFEEHFFSCPECAEDVRALTTFADNARAVFRGEAAEPKVHAGVLMAGKALWLSVGLNVALLLGVGYSVLKVTPDMRRELAEARAPHFVQEVAVLGVARSAGVVREIAPKTKRIVFALYLSEPFQAIGYEIKDTSGRVQGHLTLPSPPKEESADSHISLSTGGLKPGVYDIAFWGVGAGNREVPIGQSKFRITGE